MTTSVDWGDEDEATVPEPADSWYDDAPITDEQIEAVRRDLDTPVAQRGAAFAPFVVRKLLAEIDRLNAVLDANRVVRNAAESSSRTLKGVVELLKTQRTQLRAELDKCAALNLNLVNENAEATTRADAAERELAEVREQHQPGPSLHAWRRPDGRCVHGEQEWIRKSVKAHGGEHVTAETCSYVSEWKAADGA